MANLGKLIKQADAAAESASRLVLRAMREVRGELALLADELNLTGSAADRDKAYQMIQKKMARLSRRLDALMDAQNHLAGKTAAKSAEEMTGLEVKYSAARANAIIELVTPAQGENLAAVFTQNMAQHSINALQEATVAVMREQAVAGGTMKEMKKALGERWQKAISAPPVFTDAGGHTWDTGAYLQMNIRTNTMRVYNDCLVDDVARTTGSDLVRVSTGGDPMCRLCAPWEGVILSVSGKTKGFPTYEQARQAGCFHPNCVHTIETVDDVWDGDEIELQKAHPVTKETATDPDAMDERKYKMDQERYRRKGMSADAARLAVDRDNLEANIRHGLIRSDAREIVDKLTDAQVTALCKDGNPPRFTPTKKATKKDPHAADEKFIHGKRGGVVHISRNATVEDLVKVTRVKAATQESEIKKELFSHAEQSGKSDGEKKTDTPPLTIQEIHAMKIEDALKLDQIAKILSDVSTRFDEAQRLNQADEKRLQELDDKIKSLFNLPFKERIKKREDYEKWKDERNKLHIEAPKNAFKRNVDAFGFTENNCIVKDGKISNARRAIYELGKYGIEKLYSKDVYPDRPIEVNATREERSFHRKGAVYLSATCPGKTVVHEMSHFVEFANQHVHERCLEFLQYRTRGEDPKPLRELTGNSKYGEHEVARPDKFFNPYCGKDYGTRSTEILSMGVERLTKEPKEFYNTDPEYFNFCVGIIRGLL